MKPEEPRRPIDDRLGTTLFVAALVHGVVILGVTFSAGTFDADTALPSLNVTLVVDGPEQENDDAELIANRSALGAGTAAFGLRATSAPSADQARLELGDPDGTAAADGTPRDPLPSAEQVVTRGRAPESVAALPQPTEAAADSEQRAALSIDRVVPQTSAVELALAAELPDGDDARRTLYATPSTRESLLAGYLDNWRRRVERIGTANYPPQYLGDASLGRPTLEVVIGGDGALESIVVRRSSGDKALDQAALKILRLAAPFDPLPENIRKNYDVLRFAYEWDFSGAQARAATERRVRR